MTPAHHTPAPVNYTVILAGPLLGLAWLLLGLTVEVLL